MIEESSSVPSDTPPMEGSTASAHSERLEACCKVGDQSSDSDRTAGTSNFDGKQGDKPGSRDNRRSLLDAIAPLLMIPNPTAFFGGLIGALSSRIAEIGNVDHCVDRLVQLLCQAVADGLNEGAAFREMIAAPELKARTQEPLAIAAAFLARIASSSALSATSAQSQFAAAELVRAAAQIVREARDSGVTRSWHLLPQFADAYAKEGLPMESLVTALPQLWRQFGSAMRDSARPVPEHSRSARSERSQQMILDGAVEIVILGR
jgi:hypothetical protein